MEKMPTPYGSSPPSYGDPKKQGQGQQSFPQQDQNGRFEYVNKGPIYHDFWATVLFLVHFLVFIILSGVGLNELANPSPKNSTSSNVTTYRTGNSTEEKVELPANFIGLTVLAFFIGIAIAAVLCAGYVWLMRKYPKQLMVFTFWFGIGLSVITGLIFFIFLRPAGIILGILMLAIAGIQVLVYNCWKSRIPLSALILETTVRVFDEYPASYSMTFISMAICFVYSIWWSASTTGVSQNTAIMSTVGNVALVYLVFSLYWTQQVVENALNVTIAGTLGSWYFLKGTSAMPANPTWGAAKRAYTTSFGPIAYGSLIM
jgi:MFS family permease